MLRSMFAGVSGLRTHQTAVDVVGNNIANVNTIGFKSQSTVFSDLLYNLQRGAGAPEGQRGGVNPGQVGLGVGIAGIAQNFNAGSLQTTNRATDVAIQGEGFLIVDDGSGGQFYTRAGSLEVDVDGNLVTQSGNIVQGWPAANGVVQTGPTVDDLTLPLEGLVAAEKTGTVTVGGNIDGNTLPGDSHAVRIDVVDVNSNTIPVTVTYTKTANPEEWTITASMPDPANPTNPPLNIPVLNGTFTFDPGTNRPVTPLPPIELQIDGVGGANFDPGTGAETIVLDLGENSPEGITQFADITSVQALDQDGITASPLASFNISPNGDIVGRAANGQSLILGRLALATFANPGGLERVGGTMFAATTNSGGADNLQPLTPGQGGSGVLVAGVVEASNVDLSEQFTQLILAQRGYQANARVITTSDEILQELVNLK